MNTLGLVGAGNIGEALIRGVLSSQLYSPADVMASDVRPERLDYIAREYGIKTTQDNLELVNHASVLILCVKPQQIARMLDGISGKISAETLVISIAAGITTTYLIKRLGDIQIIRAMPNTPVMVDEGATALYSATARKEGLDHAIRLFSAVGKAIVVDREELIDAVTAVSGSGPAYFFLLMEEMVTAALELNIPADIAEALIFQTARGAGVLVNQAYARGESPAELRRKVTSPRGTTEAAIHVFLERDFGGTIFAGIKRARDRSIELSREVEQGN
ncbi:MAG: pyrroline-5-carboxylate reductase [Planctomycetales bacterium]|nr:pyrroline-5-carboxylate reductase [Planctomycetales bacterium]